ncbi:cell wall hydrolase [Methylobacterium amylolyticum]|uniref:cell wall hydrolase n=1 Tax=Methylobacterium sp. NEAU 140 TaxID=3064945 RepID=UPI00351F85F1
MTVSDAERDCLGRAMYFEANRSDADGLLAVGTVVLNRLHAAIFPGSICEVVGQRGQFAAGVLTKPMQAKDLDTVADVADALLAGERHPKVAKAMYFHTAGRRYPYGNMHYVAVTGGNAFYEKRSAGRAARTETAHFAAPAADAASGPAPAAPPVADVAGAGAGARPDGAATP